jgi:hypothetical protein
MHPAESQRNLRPEKEVREEIQRFLEALESYPARFAREPKVSFEQHLLSLNAAAGVEPGNKS